MSLILPDAPIEALSIVREHAPLLLRAMGYDIREGHPFAIARPYPLYTFAIEAVLQDHPLEMAWLAAWEYLVIDGETITGLAEVAATTPSREASLRFATLHPASYARRITDTIVAAEQLPLGAAEYELRILRVPSLTALAIWLYRQNDDIILPIETVHEGVPVEGTTWKGIKMINSETTLAHLLRPIAYYRLNSNDDG